MNFKMVFAGVGRPALAICVLCSAGLFLSCAAGRPADGASRGDTANLDENKNGPSSLLPSPGRNPANAGLVASAPAARQLPPGNPAYRIPAFADLPWDKPLPLADASGLRYAVLAGGCFWCLEAVYEQVPGVIDVVSGYTDGTSGPRPSYELVSTGMTGYAEAVRIAYDPAAVSYETLLEYFWKIHNPTTLNRQGYDEGTQYRSGIYFTDESQKAVAEASMKAEQATLRDPIVTTLEPAREFWIAEEYHQDYYRLNPEAGYCQAVIAPKLEKAGFPSL